MGITRDGFSFIILPKDGINKPTKQNYVCIQYSDGEISEVNKVSAKKCSFYRKHLLFGVGYDDVGIESPIKTKWVAMLRRCVSKQKNYKMPRNLESAYDTSIICEEWLTYSNFKNWAEGLKWEGNDLDKDLFGKSMYSPEYACFIPHQLNCMLQIRTKDDGLPAGVSLHKQSFKVATYWMNKYTGSEYFKTPEEAHRYWQEQKIVYLIRVADKYLAEDKIDLRVYNRVIQLTSYIQDDIDKGAFTTRIAR